jgi:hypothetical protein
MISVEIFSPFDNPTTRVYKYAHYQGVSSRLVVTLNQPEDNEPFPFLKTVAELLLELIPEWTWPEIYQYLRAHNSLITIDDLAMLQYQQIKGAPETKILSSINQIYQDINDQKKTYGDMTIFQTNYETWLSNDQSEKEEDENKFEQIILIHQTLEELARRQQEQEGDLLVTEPLIISTLKSYYPTLEGREVTTDDGIDLFDSLVPSAQVPYLQFNDKNGKNFYRIYTGHKAPSRGFSGVNSGAVNFQKTQPQPNYDNIVIKPEVANLINAIYLTLWIGGEKGMEISVAPRDTFLTIVYDLANNKLALESLSGNIEKYLGDEQKLGQILQDLFPQLDLGEGEDINLKGTFQIYLPDFEETPFLHLVLNEPVFNAHLYLEENLEPHLFKRRLTFHFSPMYQDQVITLTMINQTQVNLGIVRGNMKSDEEISEYQIDPDSQYLQINVGQVKSREELESLIAILRLLFFYYQELRKDIMNNYGYELYPDFARLNELLAEKKTKSVPLEFNINRLGKKATTGKRQGEKIGQLQRLAPQLFVTKYARLCQAPAQPTIIDEDEIPQWENRLVKGEKRQVMGFPYDRPEWWFVCGNDEYPYPTVKVNSCANKELYPYVPCCGKKDKMSGKAISSNYRNYITGASVSLIGAKAVDGIITPKVLGAGATPSYLPNFLSSYLHQYSSKSKSLRRHWIVYDPNSILHCVCVAIDHPEYLTARDKGEYVRSLRQHLAENLRPELLKQELYDFSDPEILELFREEERYLDPTLIYRILEELFNLNLYVFTYDNNGSLEPPRHRLFHSRPLRSYRPTILVMKTLGSESDALNYELIVDYDEKTKTITKLFDEEMNLLCHETLKITAQSLTVAPTNQIHTNLYYLCDLPQIFQYPLVSQSLDDNGKMRGLTIQVARAKLLTISFFPSQPENLPVSEEVKGLDYREVLELFENTPTAKYQNEEGLIEGLWFPLLDIEFGLYVYLQPVLSQKVPSLDSLPQGPPGTIILERENVTHRLYQLRRLLSLITQCLQWLYEVGRAKSDDPQLFGEAYLLVAPGQDSLTYYDLSRLPRRFPDIQTVQEGLEYLEHYAPTFSNGNSILVYNEIFRFRLIEMLRDYSYLHPDNHRPQVIENYYEEESDFTPYRNSQLFVRREDFNMWALHHTLYRSPNEPYIVKQEISDKYLRYQDPYFYRTPEGKIQLIQNVEGGEINKAITIAYHWAKYRINLGYEVPGDLVDSPDYVIYGISQNSQLTLLQGKTIRGELLKLLYYGDVPTYKNRYAAILDLG